MKHYCWIGFRWAKQPSPLFQVKLDLQDVRSGYRCSGSAFFKGPWLADDGLEWARGMLSPVDGARLQEIEPPASLDWPSGLEEKALSYLARHHRLKIWRNWELGLYSTPGEGREDFVERCRESLLEGRQAEMKKLREIFLHRFVELEQRLEAEIRQGELEAEGSLRRVADLDALFSAVKEDLSRWFVRDSNEVIREGDLSWSLGGPQEFQERIDALRGDFVASFNRISSDFEGQACSVEEYEVPIPRSAVGIEATGFLWE